MKSQDPSLELLQPIVRLFTNGKFQQALSDSNLMLEKFPNSVILFNIAGVSNAGLMQFDDAIDSYKNALKINPHFAEAYYNMGIAQKGAGDLEEAIESYKQALKIKPDHAEAYNNIGITLEDNGDLEGAIDSYKQAIKINSDFAEAKVNLISLLSSYVPQKDNPNLIVKVNEEIRKIDIKNNISNIISDSKIVSLFSRSQDYISSFDLELKTKEDQIFRGKSMNCTRHLSIFDKHDAIPEFCFSCYKVQVEPSSIIELIKLFIIFDQLKLHENNTRKCMIELRPELSGFYKGLIYCSDLNQANEISEHLNLILKQRIGPELNSSVKRGCSQYAISYPDYKEINNSGPQLMNYNEAWRVIEESHDKKNPTHINKVSRAKLSGLNLSDVLIIRKWIDYAKGIGDPSANLLNQNTVHYQLIHDRAKARLNTFQLTTL